MIKLITSSMLGFAFVTATGLSVAGESPKVAIPSLQNAQWEEVGQLPRSLESHGTVALDGFAYVLGGWNDTAGPYSDVFFALLTPEGALEEWQQTQASLPLRLQHHAVITHDQAIYVLGGDNGFGQGSMVSDRIFRAVPNERGDILEWQEVGTLPSPLTIHAVTTIDDRVFVLGGSRTFAPDSELLSSVFTATISSEGELGEFQELTPFPSPIGWLTATAIGRQLVAISGKVSFSPSRLTESVWVSNVDDDFQLSPFAATSATEPRERHASVVLGRTLVVIAGGSTGVLSSVEATEVDSQGNISPWVELAPLPEPRYAHSAFANDNSIYVSGGFIRYGSNETSDKIFRLEVTP
ncbi:MAG: 4-oxalocrotonate tautomerase [Cyanobacteria bacterium J06642_2]